MSIDNSVTPGCILVRNSGYNMCIWTFYKVLRTTPKQMVLMELLKDVYIDDKHDGFHPIVTPVDVGAPRSEIIKTAKTNPHYSFYDPKHTYIEDHLD